MKVHHLFLLILFCAGTAWADFSKTEVLQHPQFIEENQPYIIDIIGKWPNQCTPGKQKPIISEYTGDSVLIEFEPVPESADCYDGEIDFRALVDMSDVIDSVPGVFPVVDVTVRFEGYELTARIDKQCALCNPTPAPRDVMPDAGLYHPTVGLWYWYGDDLENLGLIVSRQNQRVAVYPLIYDESGSSEWLFGGGGMVEDVYFTELNELTGGQCLGCVKPEESPQMNVVGKLTMLADRAGQIWVKVNDGEFITYQPTVYGYEEMQLIPEPSITSPNMSGRWAFSQVEPNDGASIPPTDFLPLVFDVELKYIFELDRTPPIVGTYPAPDKNAVFSVQNIEGEEVAEMKCWGVQMYWMSDQTYCVLNSPSLEEGSTPYDVELLSVGRIKISQGTRESDIPDERGSGTAVRVD